MRVDYEQLEALRQAVALAHSEINRLMYGKKVRFKAWSVAGEPRTGTIISAIPRTYRTKGKLGIAVGVMVDRVDGRVGALGDPWYGDLKAVEIIDEV